MQNPSLKATHTLKTLFRGKEVNSLQAYSSYPRPNDIYFLQQELI